MVEVRTFANVVTVVGWALIAAAVIWALSGCAASLALYQDKQRAVLPVTVNGAETFCLEKIAATEFVTIGAVGWGAHECTRPPVVRD